MLPFLFGINLLEQNYYYSYLGFICLFVVDSIKQNTSIGAKKGIFDNVIYYSGPVFVFFMSIGSGSGRSAMVASFICLLLYIILTKKNQKSKAKPRFKYNFILVSAFILGVIFQYFIIESNSAASRSLELFKGLNDYLVTQSIIEENKIGLESLKGTAGDDNLWWQGAQSLGAKSNFWWRIVVWDDALVRWYATPIFGIGFKTTFSSDTVFELIPQITLRSRYDIDLHNSWLQVLLRGGAFVFAPLVLMWIMILFYMKTEYKILFILWALFSITMVTFETPHLSIPFYLSLGMLPVLTKKAEI